MTRVGPWLCLTQCFLAAALLGAPSDANTVHVDALQDFERFRLWAKARAVPIQTVGEVRADTDLDPLRSMIRDARVVALGEPAHGAHEPLAFRNRLFKYLVQELGFTAIALESGLPQSRQIFDLVTGGPGDTEQIVRENLTWGFGAFQENEELVRWIREYNAHIAHGRKVHFYGIDLNLGGQGGFTPTPVALDQALSYLARVDPPSSRRMRAAFQPYWDRRADAGSPSLKPVEHDSMSAAIDDLIALLERERLAFVAATSEADYNWAHRTAVVARQADRVFRAWPTGVSTGEIPPAAWQAAGARDAAMADNVRWVLDQEGSNGRVLVFAHNAHVKNAATEGGIWSAFERLPNAMGQYLRSSLGNDLVIIGMSSAQNGVGFPTAPLDSKSIDTALASVGLPRFLLDLRVSPSDTSLAAWLAERRALRANFTTFLMLSPKIAFDVLFFVDSLTQAHKEPSR
jgi:erythromycin esterase